MTRHYSYRVSTLVLLEQARASKDLLKATALREGRDGLQAEGLKVEDFVADLDQAIEDGQNAEATQERLKQRYLEEAHDDQSLAEQGYRWTLRMQAKARFAMATMPNNLDLPGRLRMGGLRRARARGVVYHLRIVLPELEAMQSELAAFGLDAGFIAEGHKILADLGADRAETAQVKAEREAMTRQVRQAEERLDQLLSQLDAADQAAALARPDARRFFNLDIVHAELARLAADTMARELARPANSGDGLIDTD